MDPRRVPKIVSVCLFIVTAMALTACAGGANETQTASNKPLAAGAESKTGKALTKGAWCSETETDAQGKVTYQQISFSPKADLIVTRKALHRDGQVKAEAEDKGTWAMINDTIYLMHGDQTVQAKIKAVVRESDQANCFQLTPDEGNTQTLCECP